MLWEWIKQLDRVLRGEATRTSALRRRDIEVPVAGLAVVVVLLGFVYGFCMGWFGLFNRDAPELRQTIAATLKVPALFVLTLFVTFPSLYVFNALVGSRLKLVSLLRLLIVAIAVAMAVLASFGPIVAFFSVSTQNYPFMVLLNVLLFAVAGMLGLVFLLQTLHRMSLVHPQDRDSVESGAAPPAPGSRNAGGDEPPASAAPQADDRNVDVDSADPAGALDRLEGHMLGRHVKTVFRCWVIVFGLVGAQMGWVLRPFVGNPDEPFQWFRARESNFFEAVWHAMENLFT